MGNFSRGAAGSAAGAAASFIGLASAFSCRGGSCASCCGCLGTAAGLLLAVLLRRAAEAEKKDFKGSPGFPETKGRGKRGEYGVKPG